MDIEEFGKKLQELVDKEFHLFMFNDNAIEMRKHAYCHKVLQQLLWDTQEVYSRVSKWE